MLIFFGVFCLILWLVFDNPSLSQSEILQFVPWMLMMVTGAISNNITTNRLRQQNVRLKLKLSTLAAKANYPEEMPYKVTAEEKIKIKALARQNKKIEAIKILKTNHNMPLFDAKTYIDLLCKGY